MRDDVLSALLDHERFVITTHIRPDGDAIGSQVALGRFLTALGKQVALYNSDPHPDNLDWLPGIDAVHLFDGATRHLEQIAGADVIIVVDTNALERIGKLAEPVKHSAALKVLIDHHTDPEAWFDCTYAHDTASSTGELVYELVAAYDADLIDEPLATLLYTAIMTDTGSFRYSNVTPSVHRVVADLLERGGLNPEPIHANLYATRSPESLRLLSLVLDTLRLRYEGQVAYVVVEQRMLKETGAPSEETEGFVDYGLSISGVYVSLIFTETASGTKVSFRSRGDWHVHAWAQAFGGGGHRNASGAFVKKALDVVIRDVIEAAPRYLDALNEVEDDDEALSPEDEAYLSTLLDMKSHE